MTQPHQRPTARASRPITKARNKGIICKHYYDTGVCPDTNCPYAHFTAATRKEFPVDLCRFHDPPRKVCMRDGCRFFHGTPEAHHRLLQMGATFYHPSQVLPIEDPTDVKFGEPVSNVTPNWDEELQKARAWREQHYMHQGPPPAMSTSPPTPPTVVVLQAPQVPGLLPITPSAPPTQPHPYSPSSPPQAQWYFPQQAPQSHPPLYPHQGLQSLPSSQGDPTSPLSQHQSQYLPHGGAPVVMYQQPQHQHQLQHPPQQAPPMAMPVAPTPYPTAAFSPYQTSMMQQPQPQQQPQQQPQPQPQPQPPQRQQPFPSNNPFSSQH